MKHALITHVTEGEMMRSSNFVPLTLLFCFAAAIGAQSTQSATPSLIVHRHVPPENSWRSEAKDLATEGDTVSPEVRKARDAYWNRRLPVYTGTGGIATSSGSATRTYTGPPKELEGIDTSIWIICRFQSFHVYATSGGGGLYTEMNVRVQHVFDGHPHPGLAEGLLIDIAIAGGAAISKGNRFESGLNEDYSPHIQPGHTYLTEVAPCQQYFACSGGDFYFYGRTWDITSGVVQPVDNADVQFAASGNSRIAGTPASTIVPRFQALIDQAIQNGAK
jgi:hypothetical protein